MNFRKAYSWLIEAKDILFVTHSAPDIDGIASMLALFQALKQHPEFVFSKKNILLILEDIPKSAKFLPATEVIKTTKDFLNQISPELLVVFDAHCSKRINEKVLALLRRPPERALIFDHHHQENCEPFANSQLEMISPHYASTTALIYEFLIQVGLSIPSEAATCLLAGLYYDTGGFRYGNVSSKVFTLAANLCSYGANSKEIAQEIFSNKRLGGVQLLKQALNRFILLREGKVILTYLTKEDFEVFGYELNDVAGFLRDIEGVQLSILIKELGSNLISVSLRSKPPYPCLSLAMEFGGGGHKYACGFKFSGLSLEEAIEILQRKVSELNL